jgi:hypothetical protein
MIDAQRFVAWTSAGPALPADNARRLLAQVTGRPGA